MKTKTYVLVLVGALIGVATRADTINLKDGSIIQGTVVGMAEGLLHVDASFGASLAIPWPQVTALQTEGKVAVSLKGAAPVNGTLADADGKLMLKGGEGGDLPLPLGDVTAIVVEGKSVPAGDAKQAAEGEMPAEAAAPPLADLTAAVKAATPAPAEAEAAPVAPASVEVAPMEPAAQPVEGKIWAGRAEFGLNGQTGNKERVDVRAGIDMNRKAETWRLNLYLKGQYAEANSERAANEVMAGTRAEWDITERTYVFGKLDLEHDEFEDLEIRATATTGLGHFFVKKEKLELKGWLGAGYEHERFERDPEPIPTDLPTPTTPLESLQRIALLTRSNSSITSTTDEVIAEVGYSYRQDFSKNFRFKNGITYYPSVDDPFQEYRIAADTALEFPVGEAVAWTIRAGVRNEYDAMPQEHVDKLDTTYYLNLGYNW